VNKYKEYLRSQHWSERRLDFLRFWGYRCCLCNSRRDVEVHHRTYERIGREELTDCVVLCERCHELHTNFTGHFLTGVLKAVRDGQ
jgi:hypothetical protein